MARWSTSADASVYDWFVAPVMSAQPLPSVLQRCQWYANVVGLLLQLPFDAVSVDPSRACPLRVGGEVFCGTAAVRAEAVAIVSAALAPTTTATPASLVMRFMVDPLTDAL